MADISAFERLETLVKQPTTLPYDGWILEIFTSEVSVRLVNSTQTKRNVVLPDHIPVTSLKKGMPVRLGEINGQPMLLAILPQLEGDLNYAGRGTVIPYPPTLLVRATTDGWLVEWQAIPGADRYHVYRNDSPDESTPDDLGYTTAHSILVPYESPFIWFAVKSVSGLNESEVSGWATDQDPPPTPNTFEVLNRVDGHILNLLSTDVSLTHPGFKNFEIEQADTDTGTGTIDLGQFYLISFPVFETFGPGTIKYYRVRAVDLAGNVSEWTPWFFGYAGQREIEDKFDGYGGANFSDLQSLYWLSIYDFEAIGNWTAHPPYTDLTTSFYKDGLKGASLSGGVPFENWAVSLNLDQEGRFGNDDYVVLSYQIVSANMGLAILFSSGSLSNQFGYVENLQAGSGKVAGEQYEVKAKKSDFGVSAGSPTWASISGLQLISLSGLLYADDFRIIKADPDNPSDYNDTGRSWNKAASTGTDFGHWHIYTGNRTSEPAKPFSYGQVKTATSPTIWYLSYKPLETTQIWTGSIQAGIYIKGTNGQGGLAFFIHETAASNWNMYAIEADSAADLIRLVRWVNGTRTVIATASFTFGPSQILWLGADFKDYDADAGRIRVYASLSEGNLIQASRMLISAQDTAVGSGGSVGVLSYQSNIRFVNFRAGSPEHALTADVAFALDGPIIGDASRRVTYNSSVNRFEYSDDGVTTTPVAPITSATRPGVTKLYRRDSDTGHNVQANYDGTRWLLQGYNGDVYHAPARVAYADAAATATSATAASSATVATTALAINSGCIVYRNSAQAMATGTWTVLTFTGYYSNPQGLTWWDGATALYAPSTGWYIVFGGATVGISGGTNRQTGFAISGNLWYSHVDRSASPFPGGSQLSFSMPIYLTAGQYVQMGYYHDIGSSQNCQVLTPNAWSSSLTPFFGLARI